MRIFLGPPFTSLATMVVAGLAASVVIWLIDLIFSLKLSDLAANFVAVLVVMFGGFAGGLYWAARARPLEAQQGRGALVFDARTAQLATQKLRTPALKAPTPQFPLTVAGVAVRFEDETKHFKFMGTTGSGKSTVLLDFRWVHDRSMSHLAAVAFR